MITEGWDDLAEFEKELEARGVPYRAQRTAPYKSTPLTVWIEDLARWCAGGWRSGTPKLWALFRSHQGLIRRLFDRAGASSELPALVTLYNAMAALRQPEMAVGDWLTKIIADPDLGHLVQPGATVPLPLRFDVDEFRVLVKALTSHPRSAQTLQEFSGLARNKVVLQSLHGSKGLQYWAVFLPALESGVLPRYLADNAEARRLFYVGLTRARREVHLMCSGYYVNAKGKKLAYGASPFVGELWKRLNSSRN